MSGGPSVKHSSNNFSIGRPTADRDERTDGHSDHREVIATALSDETRRREHEKNVVRRMERRRKLVRQMLKTTTGDVSPPNMAKEDEGGNEEGSSDAEAWDESEAGLPKSLPPRKLTRAEKNKRKRKRQREHELEDSREAKRRRRDLEELASIQESVEKQEQQEESRRKKRQEENAAASHADLAAAASGAGRGRIATRKLRKFLSQQSSRSVMDIALTDELSAVGGARLRTVHAPVGGVARDRFTSLVLRGMASPSHRESEDGGGARKKYRKPRVHMKESQRWWTEK